MCQILSKCVDIWQSYYKNKIVPLFQVHSVDRFYRSSYVENVAHVLTVSPRRKQFRRRKCIRPPITGPLNIVCKTCTYATQRTLRIKCWFHPWEFSHATTYRSQMKQMERTQQAIGLGSRTCYMALFDGAVSKTHSRNCYLKASMFSAFVRRSLPVKDAILINPRRCRHIVIRIRGSSDAYSKQTHAIYNKRQASRRFELAPWRKLK